VWVVYFELTNYGVLRGGSMSFYATVVGYIQYRSQTFLDAALEKLRHGGWLDTENRWRTDGRSGGHSHPSSVDAENLLLIVPSDLYRNLARISTSLFVGATDGVLVISSVDGCFDAWVERPLPAAAAPDPTTDAITSIEAVDLEAFARKYALRFTPRAYFPTTDAITSIEAVDLEAFARKYALGVKRFEASTPGEYAVWQNQVLRAFHREFNPELPPNLTGPDFE
jgi:hypothetical protein